MKAANSYRKEQFVIIGKMVAATQPDFAASIIIKNETTRNKKDLSKLPEIIEQYRDMHAPGDLTLDTRRVLIGISLRLYRPHVYVWPEKFIATGQRGFYRILAMQLQISQAYLSKLIRQVVFWEQTNFEGLGDRVQEAIKEINEA